jgi:molecular chaperone DnaK (HSP70)
VSATPTERSGRRFIGIDLGTTNCALAWTSDRGPIRVVDVPQMVAPGEIQALPILPSFLYFPTADEQAAGVMEARSADRGMDAPRAGIADPAIVGVLAREHGALVPTRLVSSAKSWLSNPSIDRPAPILPWGADDGPRVSPVQASARVLAHLKEAWNTRYARRDDSARLERQPVVLTVPASFDEEARELTVRAARESGLEPTLLEEPLAALYAWIAVHRRELTTRLFDGALVLVCDVGGGTTDFSLIRATAGDGGLRFERVAIGEHLLLGGDNLDLALAVLVEQKLTSGGARLTLAQRQTLRRKCSAAKETLLSGDAPASVPITLLGSGRVVVGGGLATTLTRDEVHRTLEDGYLPVTPLADVPARERRVALRELGLPYESEPAITRHLAAFLARSASAANLESAVCPDAVLFNGGFFTPPSARTRVLDALASWFGRRPDELYNARPEAAVAIGAALYGRLRSNPVAHARLLIRAGAARSYYIGVETGTAAAGARVVCVMPRGTQEGSSLRLDREFSIGTNQPVAFTLYSAMDREDELNQLVSFTPDDAHRHAPLVTVLRYGKRSRKVPLTVSLRTVFTETGTLELWCESATTAHRWQLSFNLRGSEADLLDGAEPAGEDGAEADDHVVVSAEAAARASDLIRHVFAADGGASPEAIVGELENAFGHGKHAWPLQPLRKLADDLLAHEGGRRRTAAHESRWLNLVGFSMRPGFGSPLDEWRVSELRKVYAAGLAFPREVQGQVEWLVLWQRVAAGFTTGQQRELAQRVAGQLGIGLRKPPRVNPQIEREGWRLLGSLERLDAAQRARLGDQLLERVRREPRHTAWAWTLGRLGARRPLYGPLSSVVPAPVVERWIEALLTLERPGPDLVLTLIQIAARTDDPARDVPDAVRARLRDRLRAAGISEELWAALESSVTPDRADSVRIFGESLPEGLQLTSTHAATPIPIPDP